MSASEEIARAKKLLDEGVISLSEFNRIKSLALESDTSDPFVEVAKTANDKKNKKTIQEWWDGLSGGRKFGVTVFCLFFATIAVAGIKKAYDEKRGVFEERPASAVAVTYLCNPTRGTYSSSSFVVELYSDTARIVHDGKEGQLINVDDKRNTITYVVAEIGISTRYVLTLSTVTSYSAKITLNDGGDLVGTQDGTCVVQSATKK